MVSLFLDLESIAFYSTMTRLAGILTDAAIASHHGTSQVCDNGLDNRLHSNVIA